MTCKRRIAVKARGALPPTLHTTTREYMIKDLWTTAQLEAQGDSELRARVHASGSPDQMSVFLEMHA